MADPGFPVGVRGPRRGPRGLLRWLSFENFVCQNERIWTLRGGACAGTPLLDTPMASNLGPLNLASSALPPELPWNQLFQDCHLSRIVSPDTEPWCGWMSSNDHVSQCFPGCTVLQADRWDIYKEFTVRAEGHDKRQTLLWAVWLRHTTGCQPQTVSICYKHGCDILLDTNLKLWVSLTNMGTIYYWIPTWKCEYKSQTWIWHTTGYQPQTMSINQKHGCDILLDTNLKPWVSMINMGMIYYWIPTSNHEYLSQTLVWHTTGYLPQTMNICHKHGYDIQLDTNLKP